MKLITGLVILSLMGCASVVSQNSDDEDIGTQQLKETGSVKDFDKEIGLEDKKTAISPEVLYLLMTAEIAGQRKQYDVSLEAYLQAAKRVDDVRLSERAAKIGLFLKDTDKTDEAVLLWLEQDDKNITARKIAALTALRKGDEDASVKHLNRILEDDPAGFESSLMELATLLGKEGKADAVFSALNGLAVMHPEQASIFFVQSMLAGQMNNLDEAKEKVNQALALQPKWNKALILLAQISIKKGELEEAKTVLEKILSTTPDDERVNKMLAQVLMQQGDFEGALKIYQQLLKINPEDGSAQFALALIYLQQEKLNDAEKQLLNLVNKPAWDARASFYLGRINFKQLDYEKALVWFDKVTQGPYKYDASMAAVSVLINQKKYDSAEQRINQLLERFPNEKISTILLKAEVLSVQDKYQEAFNILTDALVQFPDNGKILYTRSLIAEKMGRLDILEADLKKIIEKTPNDASALNALGYTLVDKTERYEEAGEYLEKALKLKPNEAVIIDSMGWLQFKLGNIELALKYLRDAYNKQPESEIAAHLAEVLWGIGQKSEARDIFDQAIQKSPDDVYLIKFQQQFLNKK